MSSPTTSTSLLLLMSMPLAPVSVKPSPACTDTGPEADDRVMPSVAVTDSVVDVVMDDGSTMLCPLASMLVPSCNCSTYVLPACGITLTPLPVTVTA